MIRTAGKPSSRIHVWLIMMVATTAGAVQHRLLLHVRVKHVYNIKSQCVWMASIKRIWKIKTILEEHDYIIDTLKTDDPG